MELENRRAEAGTSSIDETNKMDVPFYADPYHQLLVFHLRLSGNSDVLFPVNTRIAYKLCVSAATFHERAKHLRTLTTPPENTIHVPWEQWAHETRMMKDYQSTIQDNHASRMRLLSAEPHSSLPGTKVLCLYDFSSPLSIRRDCAYDTSYNSKGTDITHEGQDIVDNIPVYHLESTVIDGPIWAETVTTSLPYRKTRSNIVIGSDDWYSINEDSIILKPFKSKYARSLQCS